MKRVLVLTLFLVSCSHLSKSRMPASKTNMGCIELGQAFNDIDLLQPPIKINELPRRELASLEKVEQYKNLAQLNYHKDNQKKTYYIISLLNEKYPGSSVDEILERYKKLFTECN